MPPINFSEKRNFRPSRPLMAAPARGNNGTSQMYLYISFKFQVSSFESKNRRLPNLKPETRNSKLFLPLQNIDLVNQDRFLVPIKRNHYPQANCRFRCRHYDDEDRKHLTGSGVHVTRVLQVARHRDEIQIGRIENKFDRHEDDDDVATRQHTGYADDKKQRANRQKLRQARMSRILPNGGQSSARCFLN